MGRNTAILLAAALLQAGCASHTALMGGDGGPSGTVRVASAVLGNVELKPTVCTSGERQLFLGADFLDGPKGIALRLILDPTGEATVRAFNTARPLEPGVYFRRGACRKFQVSLERTGWRINEVYGIRVTLDVDCGMSSDYSIQGMLAAASCH